MARASATPFSGAMRPAKRRYGGVEAVGPKGMASTSMPLYTTVGRGTRGA
jgi:hypothetical protein